LGERFYCLWVTTRAPDTFSATGSSGVVPELPRPATHCCSDYRRFADEIVVKLLGVSVRRWFETSL